MRTSFTHFAVDDIAHPHGNEEVIVNVVKFEFKFFGLLLEWISYTLVSDCGLVRDGRADYVEVALFTKRWYKSIYLGGKPKVS